MEHENVWVEIRFISEFVSSDGSGGERVAALDGALDYRVEESGEALGELGSVVENVGGRIEVLTENLTVEEARSEFFRVESRENGVGVTACANSCSEGVCLEEADGGEEAAEIMRERKAGGSRADLDVWAAGILGFSESIKELLENGGDGESEQEFEIFAAARVVHEVVGPGGRSVSEEEIGDEKMRVDEDKEVHADSKRRGLGAVLDVDRGIVDVGVVHESHENPAEVGKDVEGERETIGDVVTVVSADAVDEVVLDRGRGSTFGLIRGGQEATLDGGGLDRGGDLKSLGGEGGHCGRVM